MKKPLCRWQLAGFLFTSAAGTLLHFLYDWSGQSILIAPFSGVNESIWEHMKLLYFPMLVFAVIESIYWKEKPKNFWCMKLLGFLFGLLLIPALYYTYTGALGVFRDWVNISIFFLSAGAAYVLECHGMKHGKGCCISSGAAVTVMALIGLAFVLWTFRPPLLPLFQDPVSRGYGIG